MELLNARYALVRPLGSGGQATTWLATDTHTGRAVTVKRLSSPLDAEDERDRETALLSQLDHPQIPRFVDAFVEDWRMQHYLHLVLEYVDGQPLTEVLAARRFDQDEVRDLVVDLLGIVDWLHGLGPPVIHRDIKPSNIVMRPDGRLVLIDFGLATDAIDRTFQHTMAAGTLGYQAPEQIAGDPRPASDVYSVGVLAWQMLTRTAPRQVLSGQTLEWSGRATHLSPRWRAWLKRALETEVAKRFADAGEALAALQSTSPEVPAAAASATIAPPVAAGVAGVMLLLSAGGVGGWLASRQSDTAPITTPVAEVPVPVQEPTPPRPSPPSGTRPTPEAAAACRSGDTDACIEAAARLDTPDARGQVPQANRQLRDHLLATACLVHKPGRAEACMRRAETETDGAAAAPFLAKACALGVTEACSRQE